MSSSGDDSDYCYAVKSDHFVGAIGKKTPKTSVKISNIKCDMLIDTGASVNILDEQTYHKEGSPKLQRKNIPHLHPYGGG